MARFKSAKKESNNDLKIKNAKPRIAVMGVGNLLLKDEGVGIHVINRLKTFLGDRVEIIDAGTAPDIFTLVKPDIERLIIVDAANGNGEPGTIYRLTAEEISATRQNPFSLHDVGVAENIRLLSIFNPNLKSIIIIGIQIKSVEYGLDLTPEIEKQIPEVIKLILSEIESN